MSSGTLRSGRASPAATAGSGAPGSVLRSDTRTSSPACTKPWPIVMMRAVSGSPEIHIPSVWARTTSMALKATVPSSPTVFTPSAPSVPSDRTAVDTKCASTSWVGMRVSALMPEGMSPLLLGVRISTRNVRVWGSAEAEMKHTRPASLAPVA
jgi:hypothetical protein